jgi:hypothetical protein
MWHATAFSVLVNALLLSALQLLKDVNVNRDFGFNYFMAVFYLHLFE